MLRNALGDTANWHTRKWSNCTKFQVLVWMIINSIRRNSFQLEKCQQFAHKLSWHACIWHELVDLTYCGRSTSLRDQSQYGLRHVTDAWQDWFPKIHHTNVFRQHRNLGNTEQHCRLGLFQDSEFACDLEHSTSTSGSVLCFFEVEHLFPSVGCARSKLLSRTVLRSLILFLWMPDCVWMGHLLLIFEALRATNNNVQPKHTSIQETDATPKPILGLSKSNRDRRLSNWVMWIMHPQTHFLLKMSLGCASLKTTKPWSKWSLKDEVQRWDTCPEPTELLLVGYSTESIWNPRSKSNMLKPKTNSQPSLSKEVSQEMSGITFCVSSTLCISRCILVAISVIFFLTIRLESRALCQKEVRRRLRMKALRRRKRNHVWLRASKRVRKSLHKVWDLWSIGRMPMKEKKPHQHPGTWCNPTQSQKSDILKRVDETILH